MGAVLLTGATGFVDQEPLRRLLDDGDRSVHALVRAPDDRAAAERLPAHARLNVVAGDIEQPGLGLSDAARARLTEEVTTVVHCAASVSFDLSLEDSRRINVDGTRNVVGFAERCRGLERLTYISTAYVAGEPRGLFREDQLDVGQRFRNPYEQSKFEAERMIRDRAGELLAGAPPEHHRRRQPHRPHLVVQRALRAACCPRAAASRRSRRVAPRRSTSCPSTT